MMGLLGQKTLYIVGRQLFDLSSEDQVAYRDFYERISDLYIEVIGETELRPHFHCDIEELGKTSPSRFYELVSRYIEERTSILLVAAAHHPSPDFGLVIQMAKQSNVPVILICQPGRENALLLGNPAIWRTIRDWRLFADLRCAFEDFRREKGLHLIRVVPPETIVFFPAIPAEEIKHMETVEPAPLVLQT